ncbi:PAAR domain-containing protein [Paraburkholderia xenovorans]|uniref:cytidine deaminase-like fold-containing protein n=1 Tax=Paraburkholderia xenovorans TaxID=36873 RepID=UPI0038B97116
MAYRVSQGGAHGVSVGATSFGAAREGDEIGHDFGMMGMVAGMLAGAAIGAAIVAAGVATGGLAIAAITCGAVAMGGLSGGSLAHGIQTLFGIADPTTGVLAGGSSDTYVNGRRSQRAGVDGASFCNGLFGFNHTPIRVKIAQGSKTVRVNGKPMARVSSQMTCGAVIKTGSSNVRIGGPTETVLEIDDAESELEMALGVLGLVALGLGGAAAISAGLLATVTFAGLVTASGFGMKALKSWGDSLAPGVGDIMVGVVGFALLGLGPRLDGEVTPGAIKPIVTAKGEIGGTVFSDVNQTARATELADPNKPTLIADRVSAKAEATGKALPNGNMADAHAEIGAIQQAFDAGTTQGANMSMTVTGKDVCGFCKGDIAAAADKAGLNSLTIQAEDDVTGLPKTYYWSPGMKSIKVRP